MKYIDVHAHYEDEKYNEDLEEVLKEIRNSGIEYIINAGSSFDESIKGLEIVKKHENMYCTLGIHPYYPEEIDKVDEFENIYLENKDKVVAIGEIGLDYHISKEDREAQIELFRKQIRLAKKLNLPIQIHSRDAAEDTIEVLKSEELPEKVMFHCFDLNPETAKYIIKNGWSISVGGNITYKRKSIAIEVLKSIPIDKIMTETDAPYLSPEGHRGERNSSKNIPQIVEKIAEINEIPVEELAKILYENAKTFYNI